MAENTEKSITELRELMSGFTYLEPKLQRKAFSDLLDIAVSLNRRLRILEQRFTDGEA